MSRTRLHAGLAIAAVLLAAVLCPAPGASQQVVAPRPAAPPGDEHIPVGRGSVVTERRRGGKHDKHDKPNKYGGKDTTEILRLRRQVASYHAALVHLAGGVVRLVRDGEDFRGRSGESLRESLSSETDSVPDVDLHSVMMSAPPVLVPADGELQELGFLDFFSLPIFAYGRWRLASDDQNLLHPATGSSEVVTEVGRRGGKHDKGGKGDKGGKKDNNRVIRKLRRQAASYRDSLVYLGEGVIRLVIDGEDLRRSDESLQGLLSAQSDSVHDVELYELLLSTPVPDELQELPFSVFREVRDGDEIYNRRRESRFFLVDFIVWFGENCCKDGIA